MTPEDIQTLVMQAVQKPWADFSQSHPRLAEVLSREVLVEATIDHLDDDPAYQHALAESAGQAKILEAIAGVVERYIRGFLQGIWK